MRKEQQMQSIDFEKDQEEVLDKTENIDKLADKIKEMQSLQKDIQTNEEYIKQKKKELDFIIQSGVILL